MSELKLRLYKKSFFFVFKGILKYTICSLCRISVSLIEILYKRRNNCNLL